MSVQLLDKTRKLTGMLHSYSTSSVSFNDICRVLSELMESNMLVISKTGKVLGASKIESVAVIEELLTDQVGERIDAKLNDRFLSILSTKENVNLEMLGFSAEQARNQAIVLPIVTSGERLGTMFMYRDAVSYGIDDIILAEYGTTVVALELIRAIDEEIAEAKRQLENVRMALSAMSNSEISAINHIFEELTGGDGEGVLIASKIADHAGLTRSVIVNALRKLESAGIISTRSSGMRGTYIRVINDNIYDELENLNR